jgi:hypothetical protein
MIIGLEATVLKSATTIFNLIELYPSHLVEVGISIIRFRLTHFDDLT